MKGDLGVEVVGGLVRGRGMMVSGGFSVFFCLLREVAWVGLLNCEVLRNSRVVGHDHDEFESPVLLFSNLLMCHIFVLLCLKARDRDLKFNPDCLFNLVRYEK